MTDGFLSRWSKRKAGNQDELVEKKLDAAAGSAEALEVQSAEEQAPPPVTLEDVEKIDRFDPDFSAKSVPITGKVIVTGDSNTKNDSFSWSAKVVN